MVKNHKYILPHNNCAAGRLSIVFSKAHLPKLIIRVEKSLSTHHVTYVKMDARVAFLAVCYNL